MGNWKRPAHQSSPRCTKVLVVVCQAVCQTCLVPLVVTLLVLPLEDQPLKKSINSSSTVCMQGDNQPTQYNACFTAIVTVKYVPFPVTPICISLKTCSRLSLISVSLQIKMN